MYSRVKKVFIGKDISRTSSLVVFPYLNGGSTADNIADGEVVVLDKNRNPLTDGYTISESDTIYIAEGLSTEQTYANEAGTSITARKILLSEPIKGSMVRKYSGKAYTAKAERTTTLGYVNQTITAGDEYIMRIVYKDIKEHPGQYTHTYRWIADANTAASDALMTKFAELINKHDGARVTATVNSVGSNTDTTTLTAKAIPSCTTSLNDIDEFRMVDFEVFFYWIDQTASGSHGVGPFNAVTLSTDITYTGPTYGQGTWELVRDAEKSVITQQFGPTNRTHFPVITPDKRTVKSETYDTLVIEHDDMIQTPDNGYMKPTRKATVIFIPNTATSNQMGNVVGKLNSWMASTPGAFAAVSF